MAELRLPPNSVVKKGKEHKAKGDVSNLRKIKIYRYDPDLDENPTIDSFEIDLSKTGPMVLDALMSPYGDKKSLAFRRREDIMKLL